MLNFRFVVVMIALAAGSANAGEWPKWLGPDGSGISKDPIAAQWPSDGPKKLWSHKVGLGFTSLVGLDGKVYFLAMNQGKDVLTALEAETGKVLWAQSYPVTHKGDAPQALSDGLPMPEATPTIDGDRIYTYGGGGDLYCRNLADGTEVWKLNVLDETHAEILSWNQSSSPLVTSDLVYVQGGKGSAAAIAVDKKTGKIAWKSERGMGGYAAPIIVDVKGTPELIVFGGQTLYALNPKTGATLWKEPWVTSYDVNAATPIYRDGHLYITTGYGHGGAMFNLTPSGAKLEWHGNQIGSKYQPCILDGDMLIGNSGGVLKCLKWPTNKQVWSTREIELSEGGSFIINGDKIICLSERGKLTFAQITPDGPKVLNESSPFSAEKIWSDPVIYHSKLYIKGTDELICYDISK